MSPPLSFTLHPACILQLSSLQQWRKTVTTILAANSTLPDTCGLFTDPDKWRVLCADETGWRCESVICHRHKQILLLQSFQSAHGQHTKFRIKQPTRCIKYPTFILSKNSTCFGHLLCPSSGVIYCTHGKWYVSCRLEQPVSARKWSHTLWKVPIAVRTVDNSWWWAQKMSETCRILRQNKCWILDASSWLFYTKLITMYGHLNIKYTKFPLSFPGERQICRIDSRHLPALSVTDAVLRDAIKRALYRSAHCTKTAVTQAAG